MDFFVTGYSMTTLGSYGDQLNSKDAGMVNASHVIIVV